MYLTGEGTLPNEVQETILLHHLFFFLGWGEGSVGFEGALAEVL